MDLCEYEVSLLYVVSSGPSRAARETLFKIKTQREGGHQQAKERGLKSQLRKHFDIGFLASKSLGKECVLASQSTPENEYKK